MQEVPMSWMRFRRVVAVIVLTLGASAGLSAAAQPGSAGKHSAGQSGAGGCIAHHPNSDTQYPVWYTAVCSGHDEPELDPVSSLAGSARNLTWTAVLPSDGT